MSRRIHGRGFAAPGVSGMVAGYFRWLDARWHRQGCGYCDLASAVEAGQAVQLPALALWRALFRGGHHLARYIDPRGADDYILTWDALAPTDRQECSK